MPRIQETTVYQFDELSDHAKDKARAWFRDGLEPSDYAESVIEDASRMGAILGIDMNTQPVKLMGGGTRMDPSVYWDLDRGSYASIDANYSYKRNSVKAIKTEAPQDTTLHTIAAELQDVQRRNFYRLSARLTHGRHESQDVEVFNDRSGQSDVPESDADAMREALQDFAGWIYTQLQAEYEYRMSDAAVDEDIRANEYEFDADGGRA